MTRRHVDWLQIRNYGPIRDLQMTLTPLHALVGPNDSGKSTVLAALRTVTLLAAAQRIDLATEEAARLRALLEARAAHGEVQLTASSSGEAWRARIVPPRQEQEELFRGPIVEGSAVASRDRGGHGFFPHGSLLMRTPEAKDLATALSGSLLLRLDPDALRRPASLVPDGSPLRFQDARGSGLPGLYDAVLGRDMAAFQAINRRAVGLFPAVDSLSLKNPTANSKAMGVKLVDGTYVPAEAMSEGLLYFLAFALLPYLEPTAMVLIEEPENGLHPARIAEVMRVLRELSATTQIVIATHSPLVLNELRPEEVTVLTRDPAHGTRAQPIASTPRFSERSKVYALGELWVSYCNGVDEGPLLSGDPRS